MRLAKILLGSAAMVAVGTAAQAADPNPVAPPQTAANYVEQCASTDLIVEPGMGFLKPGGDLDYCLALYGMAEFESEFGMELDYGDGPADTVSVPVGGDGWDGFDFTPRLGLVVSTTTAYGPLELAIPIVGADSDDNPLYLRIGGWTFTGDYVSYYRPFGTFGFGFNLVEPGSATNSPDRLWPENVAVADHALDYTTALRIPDFEGLIGASTGAIEFLAGGYWGQRTTILGGIGDFNTYGAAFDFNVNLMSVELAFGGAFDMTVIDPTGAAPALGNAYALSAGVTVPVGAVEFELSTIWARNSGMYTDYAFNDQPAGTYWEVFASVAFDVTETWAVEFDAEYDDGPVDLDGVLQVGAEATFNPFGSFEVTAGAFYEWTRTGDSAVSGAIGASIEF